MREIKTHKGAGGANEQYRLFADTWQQGDKKREAPIRYDIASTAIPGVREGMNLTTVRFQDGPLTEALPDGDTRPKAPNGLTNEILLAIVLDRLQRYQIGDYVSGVREFHWAGEGKGEPPTEKELADWNASLTVGKLADPHNEQAIELIDMAIVHLQQRTKERLARGVEGTKTP